MSDTSPHAVELCRSFEGAALSPDYVCFITRFNEGRFFEAHHVLEKLWLPNRHRADGDFFKGLIQLAGAFVHLQRDRLRPSGALLKLARANLAKYPPRHHCLDTERTRGLIDTWLDRLELAQFVVNPLLREPAPCLVLAG